MPRNHDEDTRPLTYRDAGVDIDAGDALVERIKPHVRRTFRPEVIGDLGGFGGLFAVPRGYTDPVLVSGTDGVGTKLKVAFATGRHDTIGIDLVAMCVNDIAVSGAEPLFFLDYFASGKLEVDVAEAVVRGIADGCRQAGCALVGGEMAEHPGSLAEGQFDLAGFAVGVVERDQIISGERVVPGDVLVGLPSPGLRSNGYSLARRVLLERAGRALDEPAFDGAHHTLADELLLPSVIYAPVIGALVKAVDVRAIAHVTGGGIPGNLARVLPDGCDAEVHRRSWETPRIFAEIQRLGGIDADEMARVFNLGLGMIVAVPRDDLFHALDLLRSHGHAAVEVGEVVPGRGAVRIE